MKHTRKRSMKRRGKTMKRHRGGAILLTPNIARNIQQKRLAQMQVCEAKKPKFFTGCGKGCMRHRGKCYIDMDEYYEKKDPVYIVRGSSEYQMGEYSYPIQKKKRESSLDYHKLNAALKYLNEKGPKTGVGLSHEDQIFANGTEPYR